MHIVKQDCIAAMHAFRYIKYIFETKLLQNIVSMTFVLVINYTYHQNLCIFYQVFKVNALINFYQQREIFCLFNFMHYSVILYV